MKGGRILVVDGDPSTRTARTRTLRDAGYTVFETGSLADTTVLVRQIFPDLLTVSDNLLNCKNLELRRALDRTPTSRYRNR